MKKLACIMLTLAVMVSMFAGCTKTEAPEDNTNGQTQQEEQPPSDSTEENGQDGETADKSEKVLINVALLKGPTAMGAAALMNESENGFVFGHYSFEVYNTPDEVTAKIINGDVSVAAVPVNLASALYNKTEGEVLIAAVNTLGNLYIVENGSSVSSLADLSGKTVVMAGQGAVPEYVMEFILSKAGITDTTLSFVSSHSDAVAAIVSGDADIALLPEPFATAAMKKVSGLNIAIDVAEIWDEYSYEEKGVANTLPMGCIVVRKDFLDEYEKEFSKFLDEYDYFIDVTNDEEEIDAVSEYIVTYGIVDDKEIASESIPRCNIIFIDGSKMLRLVDNFLSTMYEFNPKSVGGAIPEEDFYYIRN